VSRHRPDRCVLDGFERQGGLTIVGALMQAFYWDCPGLEGRDGNWWNHVKGQIPALAQIGFNALWLPPASKAANIGGVSTGYDPYDYYDVGEFDQKGRRKTWFGSRQELLDLINEAHAHNMQV
jgi:alpha-amylase